jgi:hypothetical protein
MGTCFLIISLTNSSIFGFWIKRLTAKGFLVNSLVFIISFSSQLTGINPEPIVPKPPALETAETNLLSEIPAIPP